MDIDYKIYSLKNGIKVIYLPRKDNNITSISVFCRVGSRNEPEHLKGASHFLEHMLFKGTDKRPHSKEITGELDSVGAYFNAYTDKNVTSYIVKIDSKYFNKGIDIISDMLMNSKIREEDVKMEKLVVVEEISRAMDNPSDQISDKIYEIIYKGHPLEHSIGSDDKHILNYDRDEVMKYYKKYYCSDNIVISISTNLDFSTIKKTIQQSYFPKYKKSKSKLHKNIVLKPQKQRRYTTLIKDLEQTHLAIGFPIEGMHTKDKFCLDLIKIILAGNMSSRLFIDLREKNGLAYNVSVDLSYYNECGSFIIGTSFDKDSLFIKNEDKSYDEYVSNLFSETDYKIEVGGLPIILENIIRLKNEKISKKELENAKGFLRGHLILEKEDSHSITDYFGKQVLFGFDPILNFGYMLEQFEKITRNDMRKVCRKYFDFDKMNIAVIGNYNEYDIKSFIDSYKFK